MIVISRRRDGNSRAALFGGGGWELQGMQLFHIGAGATVACDKARARQGLLVRPDKI